MIEILGLVVGEVAYRAENADAISRRTVFGIASHRFDDIQGKIGDNSHVDTVANVDGSNIIKDSDTIVAIQIPANFCYAELASAYPEDGGQYVYFREAGSRPLAFLCGWISFWGTDPPSISIMALAIVNYLAYFLPMGALTLKLVATAFVLFFMFMHMCSVEGGGKFQTVITALKIIPFALIIGIGAFFVNGEIFMSTTRLSGGLIMPCIAILMPWTLIWGELTYAPIPSLICAALVIGTGLPVYCFWEKKNKQAA